jgi:hypothetical protein
MSSIKNVVLAGASGSLGSVVFEKLVASGQFNIRILKRIGSSSTFPAGTDVVEVDYTSQRSLEAALKGQDAVVSTVAALAGADEKHMIDAAAAAGIKRFLPSEFGSNLDNISTRNLPVYKLKVQIQDYLIEKSKSTELTYTLIYNNAFLDWGLKNKFILDLSSEKPQVIDGGDLEFSTTTLASIGDAVVGVLKHPDETKNRAVYIHDAIVTQNKLIALAREIEPTKSREPVSVSLDDMTAESKKKLSQGIMTQQVFIPYIYRAILDPAGGGIFRDNDNELLGVKGKTDAEVKEVIKEFIE